MLDKRLWLLLATTVLLCAIASQLPRIPQDPAYHDLADRRTFFGIPNAFDVLSNLPFLIIGAAGLWTVARRQTDFASPPASWPWTTMFTGIVCISVGSAYYHLEPSNPTLLWDRLPMTIVFMSLLAVIVSEWISVRAAAWLLCPLLVLGISSVLWWYQGELRGDGDLRFYAVIQFGPLLIIPLILLLYPAGRTRPQYLAATFAAYVLAKICELADARIFSWGGTVSGHTLKHLFAGLATWFLLRMMRARQPATQRP